MAINGCHTPRTIRIICLVAWLFQYFQGKKYIDCWLEGKGQQKWLVCSYSVPGSLCQGGYLDVWHTCERSRWPQSTSPLLHVGGEGGGKVLTVCSNSVGFTHMNSVHSGLFIAPVSLSERADLIPVKCSVYYDFLLWLTSLLCYRFDSLCLSLIKTISPSLWSLPEVLLAVILILSHRLITASLSLSGPPLKWFKPC